MARLFDVRRGEGRGALFGFAALLMLIITGHTILEAARDALLLAGPGPRALGFVYIVIALCTWPAAAVAARGGERFGARRALAAMLILAAGLAVFLFVAPASRTAAMAVYVVSGVIGSVVVPQFWTYAGSALTLAQGRRLFGIIAAAGVLGGVLGSGAAAAALLVVPVRALLVLASGVFLVAWAAMRWIRTDEQRDRATPHRAAPLADSLRAFREQPFLKRIALAVVLSTATLLALDYCFKETVALTFPPERIGPFVARYYLALNALSLVVQLFLSTSIVRRLGVPSAIALTPLLLAFGAGGAFLTGGALAAVLAMKAIDGGLRFSLHRITAELSYLPLTSAIRQRVKPFIDGALGRASQTVTGALLLVLGGTWIIAPRPLAAIVTLLACAWVGVALTMRRPYLALLRRTVTPASSAAPDVPDQLDLESAQLLVQRLASEDATEVVAAMNALVRRRRAGFISALVLLHPDESVLTLALDVFATSARDDWVPLARKLLDDRRDKVRMAAARALASRGALEIERIADDVDCRLEGYAVVDLALRDGDGEADVRGEPRVTALLSRDGVEGDEARLGMLAAIADAPPNARLSSLLLALFDAGPESLERTELLARAAAKQGDEKAIPKLVAHLDAREGREAVRAALVAMGDPALEAVCEALGDTSRPRALRIHVPKTLARFGTKRAADRLLQNIEEETDGLVRYKSIRALAVLVGHAHLRMDRGRVLGLVRGNLLRYFWLLGARVALASGSTSATAPERLLVGMLDDKLRQSVDRAFRLLEIAYPHENIHHVRLLCFSGDAYARANAREFLDTLLRRRHQQDVRALLRLVTDDLALDERLRRGIPLLPTRPPATRADALAALTQDTHSTLVALAVLAAGAGDGSPPGGQSALATEVVHARAS